LGCGFSVHTLTNRAAPPSSSISSSPLRFDPDHLEQTLRGADVLVNTYWVRLPARGIDFDTAVRNSRILLTAARRAGVGRLVHVSVSNADEHSRLSYYRAKGEVERIVRESGVAHTIVRPTLVVGPDDVLTSNIAWMLRRLPVFLLPGGGRYRLQPITLRDTGRILSNAAEATGNDEIDAAGPDIVTFSDYVRLVARACGVRRWIVGAPASIAMIAVRAAGLLLRDIVLAREELEGLIDEKLVSHESPRGTESVASWITDNGERLGRGYVNDMRRHFGPTR
jgi:NADH dehydrogenase